MNTKAKKSTSKGFKKNSAKAGSQCRRKNSCCNHAADRWLRHRRADLMAHASDAEKAAYRVLCALGYKVIRQHPINTGRRLYFADLYVPALRAVVEIDGGYHFTSSQRRLDTNRSRGLWRLGYHVLRLSNHDARDPNKIKSKIAFLGDS